MSGTAAKDLVQKFLASGLSKEYISDDFVWRIPPSLVNENNHDFTADALDTQIHEIHEKIYDVPTMKSTVDFLIGDDEWAAYQFEVKAKTIGGDDYHNFYCLTFRVRDGKICEAREHVDSMYAKRVLLGPAGL